MLIILKEGRGEEITRMIDAQWILHIFEAAHLEAQANRVQMTLGWVKNRMTKKYQTMKANGKMIAMDDKSKLRHGKIDLKRTS
jgi:hypothetical protein